MNAYTRIKSIYNATRTSPGTKAPRNISPALVEPTSNTLGIDISPVASLNSNFLAEPAWSVADASWSASIIKTIDGGIIWPNVPEAAIVPVASD